ncbi:hypothetical protein HYFRA_00008534 [Hymenoscyphus fraxineus]|uniref:Uncharacterized protein n=1 Tax=Hymenoscyphus fraxineus TaxID=746836 RepID=A0A9N9PTS4_9HELO|nr:hypothetical protein HYFRA_00008534 [Hymenoscyphus fraxineus]
MTLAGTTLDIPFRAAPSHPFHLDQSILCHSSNTSTQLPIFLQPLNHSDPSASGATTKLTGKQHDSKFHFQSINKELSNFQLTLTSQPASTILYRLGNQYLAEKDTPLQNRKQYNIALPHQTKFTMSKKILPPRPSPSPQLIADRIFDPNESIKKKLSTKLNPATGLTTLQYEGNDEAIPKIQLLIRVDGVNGVNGVRKPEGNDNSPLTASCIFFGRNSPYNLGYCDMVNVDNSLATTINKIVMGLMDEQIRPQTAIPIQNVVIQTCGAKYFEAITKNVWHQNFTNKPKDQWEHKMITIHKALLQAKSETKISIRFQLVSRKDLGESPKRIAEQVLRLGNSELALRQSSKPDPPKHPNAPPVKVGAKRSRQPPSSQAGSAWAYAGEYASTDPEIKMITDRIILRLEYPLGSDNEWSKSVQSFLIRRALYQWDGKKDLNQEFLTMFGANSIRVVDQERWSLARQIKALQKHLVSISDEAAFDGDLDFIESHAAIAEAATLLRRIRQG